MDQMTLGLLVFAIFGVGVLAGYLAMRLRVNNTFDRAKAELLAEQAGLTERLRGREAQIDELRGMLDHEKKLSDRFQQEARSESERRATADTRLEAAKSMADEKLQALEQAQAQLMTSFQALAAEALKNNNQSFLDLAGQTLSRFQQSAQLDLEGRQNQISAVLASALARNDHTLLAKSDPTGPVAGLDAGKTACGNCESG